MVIPITRVGYFLQDFTGVGLVALDATLVHATAFLELHLAFPTQGMPVADQYLTLAQLVQHTRRHNAELLVVVVSRRRGRQHRLERATPIWVSLRIKSS